MLLEETYWVWHDSFVGKKLWRAYPLCRMLVVDSLERNEYRKAFNDVEQFNQAIKSSFMYTFVDWGWGYIEGYTMSMLDFVNWLNLK